MESLNQSRQQCTIIILLSKWFAFIPAACHHNSGRWEVAPSSSPTQQNVTDKRSTRATVIIINSVVCARGWILFVTVAWRSSRGCNSMYIPYRRPFPTRRWTIFSLLLLLVKSVDLVGLTSIKASHHLMIGKLSSASVEKPSCFFLLRFLLVWKKTKSV